MNTNPNAKNILCYGDSNTWGAIPWNRKDRLPANLRWTGVLQDLLGNEYEVIEEGLSGRTLVVNNPERPRHTGITHLEAIIRTHRPFDFMAIMLGTNDAKSIFNLNSKDIANHLEQTIEFIQTKLKDFGPLPIILVICPPAIVIPSIGKFDETMRPGVAIFKELPDLFKQVAQKMHCGYLNAGDFISLENTDGYHLSSEDHKKLGMKIAELIKSII